MSRMMQPIDRATMVRNAVATPKTLLAAAGRSVAHGDVPEFRFTDIRGAPVRRAPAVFATTLVEEGTEHRRGRFANALVLGKALAMYATSFPRLIFVNVALITEMQVASLEQYYQVIAVDCGDDDNNRNITLVYALGLGHDWHRVVLLSSNTLPLRNVDELAALGVPAVASLGDYDIIDCCLTVEMIKSGIAVFRPSYAWFLATLAQFGTHLQNGSEEVAWRILISVIAEGTVTCIPLKYHVDPYVFEGTDAFGKGNVVAFVGYRRYDGIARDVWNDMFEAACTELGANGLSIDV